MRWSGKLHECAACALAADMLIGVEAVDREPVRLVRFKIEPEIEYPAQSLGDPVVGGDQCIQVNGHRGLSPGPLQMTPFVASGRNRVRGLRYRFGDAMAGRAALAFSILRV